MKHIKTVITAVFLPSSKESLAAQAKKSNKLLITRSLREKSGKLSVGQLGHKGTTLEMVSDPDSIIEHQSDYCTRCGESLSQVVGSVSEVRQLFDIPAAIRPIIFEKILNECTDNLHQKIIAIKKSLTKYKDNVFKFLFNPDVPYDNNASERTIRIMKTKLKVSGMFKSDQGADTFCQIQSIAQMPRRITKIPSRQSLPWHIIIEPFYWVLSSYKSSN